MTFCVEVVRGIILQQEEKVLGREGQTCGLGNNLYGEAEATVATEWWSRYKILVLGTVSISVDERKVVRLISIGEATYRRPGDVVSPVSRVLNQKTSSGPTLSRELIFSWLIMYKFAVQLNFSIPLYADSFVNHVVLSISEIEPDIFWSRLHEYLVAH